MPRRIFTTFLVGLSALQTLTAALVNGPMLTNVDLREAQVWVQTEGPSEIRVTYSDTEAPGTRYWSAKLKTDDALGHTACLTLDQVEPGKQYSYQVEVDGELAGPSAHFKTPEFYHERTPAPDLRVAVGGAHYVMQDGFEPPYRILGGGYGIFSTIQDQQPDLMLWVGNTAHLRPSDWNSRSGYLKRFTTARAVPELQSLLASVPQYATWGSADYGAGDAGRYYSYRGIAEDSFRAFWPQPAQAPGLDGLCTSFRRSDVEFFLLDSQSFRDVRPGSNELPSILGNAQIEWLRNELLRSTATFKVIIAGTPVLNPAKNPGNLSFAEREQTQLLQMLRDERIGGLFFLSGGKYYGELTRLVHANSYNLYDLTLGPITANPKSNEDELNYFRMPGSSTFERHFAMLEFTGPEESRALTIRVYSMEGTELWNRTIEASQLQPAKL
ncbi:alkaline phosphatase D family protein [Coraliomargarita parva]|uniref:alkaline phosphatase D family protein n=1 Tax=Coraliomargarita parva TaxID=3014050 RepID=UPI0022B43D9A|nr:alkaline phosphatase D family protein [Coraliomargarita parva]